MFRFLSSPERHRQVALLTALLAGSVFAQSLPAPVTSPATSAPPPAPCAAEPQLLEVQISGASRGILPVLQAPSGAASSAASTLQTWVPADTLLASEAPYAAGHATCDGTDYVLLSGALDVSVNASEGQLIVRPAVRLLGGNVLDFSLQGEGTLPVVPLLLLDAATQLSGQWGVQGTQQAALLGTYASDRLSISAGLGVGGGTAQPFSATGVLSANYRPNDLWVLGAQLNPVLLGTRGTGTQTFSGIDVAGRNARGIVLPDLTLSLPLDSDILLTVDDRVLQQFHARAGTLVLKNLPLSSQSGELLVHIHDLNGTRVQLIAFQNLSATLGRRAYQLNLRAGWLNDQPVGDLTGFYGLTDTVTIQVQAAYRPGAASASVQALASTPAGQLRGGFGVLPLDSGSGSTPALAALLGYGLNRGSFSFGLDATLPFAAPDRLILSGNASYTTGPVSFGLGAGYDGTVNSALLNASVSAALSPALTLSAQGVYTRDHLNLGAQLNWRPTDRLTVSANAVNASAQTTTQINLTPGLPGDNTVSASYRVTDQATLHALVGLGGTLGAGVDMVGPLRLTAAADTLGQYGVQAEVGAVLIGNRLMPVSQSSPAGILVHTGIPDLPLRLNGGPLERTDAHGDAVFLEMGGAQTGVVSVALDDVGIETVVGDDSAEVRMQQSGLSVLDWTRNFRRVRWLQLFWSDGTPAKQAQLRLQGSPEVLWTDDDGWVQITRSAIAVPATLDDEAKHHCDVLIPVQGSQVTCSSS